MKIESIDLFDRHEWSDSEVACGIDEAGRGPLAGPVIAAAVVLDARRPVRGIRDSKKLTPRRRVELAECIRENALAWTLGRCDPQEIDDLNILRASLLAMERAVEQIDLCIDVALVDGNVAPRLGCPTMTIVGGDRRVKSIGAASILAKVARDEEMNAAELRYPNYGFRQNKGYPTPQHLAALRVHGPCPLHRRTFRPVADLLDARKSAASTLDARTQ